MMKNTSSFKGLTDWYSIKFKRVVRKIGRDDLHFHNLRDTFAVMRYIETRDIYQVSKELRHSSVKVTEKYAKFQLRRLEQGFPILTKAYKIRKATENNDFGIPKIKITTSTTIRLPKKVILEMLYTLACIGGSNPSLSALVIDDKAL